jgi:Tol biopolymer transport system component
VVGLLIALAGLALAGRASAAYGPGVGETGAEIVSVDSASDEQANAPSTDADISADGGYVVFQTKATNLFEGDGETVEEQQAAEPPGTLREGGIFRYDRQTGQLRIVASGNLVVSEGPEAGKVLMRGAVNPSVSADGRYVVFASAQRLVPQDTNENVEVYVRDMENAPSQPGSYTLASAQNGSEEPPVYDDASIRTPVPGGDPGSQLWPNTAISANGRYVLFRTVEVKSSLPDGSTPLTEPGQLFVRDLQNKTTTLITRSIGGEPAGGAEGPASISADGSTVSWVGAHAPEQTVFLPGETFEPHQDPTSYYLWRRWSQPEPVTRRITGIAEPECDPIEHIEQNPTAEGACYGPLSFPEAALAGISSQAPALSADGYTVAFLAGSELRPQDTKPDALDVFLTSMRPGVTRKAGTRELTLAVNGAQGDGSVSVTSLALSADGSHIAFTSQRNAFVLSQPAPVGGFSTTGQQSELYVIDLSTDTLERVVSGIEDSEPNGSTLANPTLNEDGSLIAFASSASNLIFGDANGVSDAFTVSAQPPGGTAPPPAGVNEGSGGFALTAFSSPELGVSVKRAKDGAILLLVETPGPGKLIASAKGIVAISASEENSSSHIRKRARTSRSKSKKAPKAPPAVLLASAFATAPSEGTSTLRLSLSSRYAHDLKLAGKLEATVTIHFTPPAPAEALSNEVSATFLENRSGGKSPKDGQKAKGKTNKS